MNTATLPILSKNDLIKRLEQNPPKLFEALSSVIINDPALKGKADDTALALSDLIKMIRSLDDDALDDLNYKLIQKYKF